MNQLIHYFILFVWLINGLYCKVLNFVPRHTEIVGRILGYEYARPLTFAIGISEVFMAVWIWSRINSNVNAWTQIIIVLIMNLIEFSLASDLLLWGKMNLIFAILFAIIIYYNEFMVNPNFRK